MTRLGRYTTLVCYRASSAVQCSAMTVVGSAPPSPPPRRLAPPPESVSTQPHRRRTPLAFCLALALWHCAACRVGRRIARLDDDAAEVSGGAGSGPAQHSVAGDMREPTTEARPRRGQTHSAALSTNEVQQALRRREADARHALQSGLQATQEAPQADAALLFATVLWRALK